MRVCVSVWEGKRESVATRGARLRGWRLFVSGLGNLNESWFDRPPPPPPSILYLRLCLLPYPLSCLIL